MTIRLVRHCLLGVAVLLGCTPINRPGTELESALVLNGQLGSLPAAPSAPPAPLQLPTLVSNNAGALISNNSASLRGEVLAPSRLVSNNAGSYRLAALEEVPLQRALVYLSDTRERMFMDPESGQVVATTTDTAGRFSFARAPASTSVVVNAVLSGNRRMVGFLDLRPERNEVALGLASTLVTEFLRARALAATGSLTLSALDPELRHIPGIIQLTRAALDQGLLALPDLNVGRIPDMNREYLLGFAMKSRPLKQAWEGLLGRELNVITTVAGDQPGFAGDGGPAAGARFQNLTKVVPGPDGSLYVVDNGNGRIRKIAPDGTIHTVAGGGTLASIVQRMRQGERIDPYGNGGPATTAFLQDPNSIVLLPLGAMLITEGLPSRLRLVRPDGIIVPLLDAYTADAPIDGPLGAKSGLNYPMSVALGPDGAIYLAEIMNASVRRIVVPDLTNPATATATRVLGIYRSFPEPTAANATYEGFPGTAVKLFNPTDLCVDAAGNLYVANMFDHRVLKLGTNGLVSVVAGNGTVEFSGDGGPANLAGVPFPSALALDPDRHRLLVGSTLSPRIRAVDLLSGRITTVIGQGASTQDGLISEAAVSSVMGMAVLPSGDVVFADNQSGRLRRVQVVGPP